MHDEPLKIWLLTDVFPPKSGGSGWSTYYLGKALVERGNTVHVLRPQFGQRVAKTEKLKRVGEYNGFPVKEILVPRPPRWAARLGIAKAMSERQAVRLMARCAYLGAVSGQADVLHGGHRISSLAALHAAGRTRSKGATVVSVATIRDYWPLCPSSTRLFKDRAGDWFECANCQNLSEYLRCVPSRSPLTRLAGLARWLRTRYDSRLLSRADALIAVSDYVNRELRRSGRFARTPIETIPNLVDLPSVDRAVQTPLPEGITVDQPFMLFAGKLDANKGALLLPRLVAAAGVQLPVFVAGEGPLREAILSDAKSRGLDFRFYDWLDNDSVISLMHRATVLLFPSAWQEPLSRVLLEGCGAGAAIVALDTGGTSDIIRHGESGWLACNPSQFSQGIREVVQDQALNARLRGGARRTAEEHFSAPVVSARVEELYRQLLAQRARP